MEQIPAPFYLIRLNPPPRKIFARQNTRQNFRWAYHDRKPDRRIYGEHTKTSSNQPG